MTDAAELTADAGVTSPSSQEARPPPTAAVDLFWIPLGAGAHAARFSGDVFEAISARVQRRQRCRLYHSALEIHAPEGRYVIEQTPVPDADGDRRGVVAGGAVGMRCAGRLRIFRYEVRRWFEGSIPDLDAAVASPVRLSDDLSVARRVLDAVPSVPTGAAMTGAGTVRRGRAPLRQVLRTQVVWCSHVRFLLRNFKSFD